MKQEQQLTPMQARRAEKRRRLRRRRIIRLTVVVVVLAFLLTAIIWSVIEISKASRGESASFFGVKAVEVEFVDGEGTVRYAKEDIIRASGIYINQSLLAVNKVKASNSVLDAFPYLDYVEIKTPLFRRYAYASRRSRCLRRCRRRRIFLSSVRITTCSNA